MKYLALILVSMCCTAMGLTTSRAQTAKSWVEVSRPDQFFQVSMPHDPTETEEFARYGHLDTNGKRYEAIADGASYVVWVLINRNQQPTDLDAYLDGCADLIWEELLRPGRDKLPQDNRVRARMT